MKFTLICIWLAFALTAKAQQPEQQDQLGLPGDNLNLYAVLKIFQESPTLEEFEKKLNDESNQINNLDLNADNKIDYIRVMDEPNGDVHNILLRVAMNATEDQDIAVIVVQKLSDGTAQVQVIGDEDLYGKNYVIEPSTSDNQQTSTPNPGYTGNQYKTTTVVVEPTTTTVVYQWPIVQYIYVPTYVVWRSPWYWNYYPTYWQPWSPWYWHQYYAYHYHWNYWYYAHYRPWPQPRYNGFHVWYYNGSYRRQSNFYRARYQKGYYNQTYRRPDLANRGSQAFVKKYPTAPSANVRLPNFDKGGNAKPIIKPVQLKPVQPRPSPNPGIQPVQPRPVQPRPSPNPGIQPVQPQPRPQPKPVQPHPVQPRPQPKPIQPHPQPKPVQPHPQPKPVQPRPQAKPAVQPQKGV